MCRWQSVEALEVYARMDKSVYLGKLREVRCIDIRQLQVTTLLKRIQQIDNDHAWKQIANESHLFLQDENIVDAYSASKSEV